MNKYYTPKIEEFHVGFEYESLVLNKWRKGDNQFPRYYLPNEARNYRVKYLDREDIESFGFFTEDNGECYNKLEGFTIFGLYPWEKPNEYKITIENNTVFLGIIKNKSELKKLLKQLDINV